MDLNIRIAGEAGQGIATTGDLLVDAFASMGLYVFSTQSYMSRIRGGLNWYDVRVADESISSGREQADLLVALSEDALTTLRPAVAEGGVVLFDGDQAEGAIAINFTKIAKDEGGSEIMANAVAAGAVFALLCYDLKALTGLLDEAFHKKGQQVVDTNIALARRGAELAGQHQGCITAPGPAGAPRAVYSGSEAVGISAAASGVRFVSSYPMTPSTGVFTHLAQVADEYGIVVEQAEDEIAAINMVCGATWAGVPAMTTTSGGGFALMQEGLSLAGMLELPALIILSQRPGPATGLPTRTAQQDLLFALHGGHGEFPRAIFAPGSLQQAHELTRRALQTAHKWQTPVILMIDQFLADLRMNIEPLDATPQPIDRKLVYQPDPDYVRYALTDSGVSPRAIPGCGAFVIADSDEHTADGHITEDLEAAVRMQDKRLRKLEGMVAEALAPEEYGRPGAEVLLLCWGSTWGPCREALDLINAAGGSAQMVHFAQLWPLDLDAVSARLALDGRRRVICIEGNATGQLAALLRVAGMHIEPEIMGRSDGLPFLAEEIVAEVMP